MEILPQHSSVPPNDAVELLPIRTVASLTGVKPVTLRAWEKRYGLIKPQRTLKGHRLYTRGDIANIQQILSWLERGVAISQISGLLKSNGPENNYQKNTLWQQYQRDMLAAINRFNEPYLSRLYNEVFSTYPFEVAVSQLILPLIDEIGDLRQKNLLSISEEKFFDAYLRNNLGARLHYYKQYTSGPTIVFACLKGEYYEIGLILFAIFMASKNYHPLVLGVDVPFDELPFVIRSSHSCAVVLSCAARKTNVQISAARLKHLVKALNVPVFIGGKIATLKHGLIVAAGAIPLAENHHAAFKQINKVIPNNK